MKTVINTDESIDKALTDIVTYRDENNYNCTELTIEIGGDTSESGVNKFFSKLSSGSGATLVLKHNNLDFVSQTIVNHCLKFGSITIGSRDNPDKKFSAQNIINIFNSIKKEVLINQQTLTTINFSSEIDMEDKRAYVAMAIIDALMNNYKLQSITTVSKADIGDKFSATEKDIISGLLKINVEGRGNKQELYSETVLELITQNEQQATTIKEQATKIEEQATTIKEQATTIKEQATTIKEQATTIKEQATKIEEQAAKIEQQEAKIKEQEAAATQGQTQRPAATISSPSSSRRGRQQHCVIS
jgi:hypothetical protein